MASSDSDHRRDSGERGDGDRRDESQERGGNFFEILPFFLNPNIVSWLKAAY